MERCKETIQLEPEKRVFETGHGINSEYVRPAMLICGCKEEKPDEPYIVERLRARAYSELAREAADLIEHLREEISNTVFCFGCIDGCEYYTEERGCNK